MKKSLFVLSVICLMVIGFSGGVYAQSACGGIVQYSSDCANSDRNWHFSCCPDDYRVQGVAYNDIKGQDHVDAVSIVCRSISKGNELVAQDFGRSPKKYVCKNKEVFAGIESKDVLTEGGGFRDTLDGVTVLCQRPGSNALEKIDNNDLTSNRREGRQQTVLLPKRVVGIAYKKIKKGESDRADCVTIVTK